MTKRHQSSIADFYTALGNGETHKFVALEGYRLLVDELVSIVGDDIAGYDYLIKAAGEVLDSDSLRNTINMEEIQDKTTRKRLLAAEKVFGIIHFNMALGEGRERMARKLLSLGLDRVLSQLSLTEINSLIKLDEAEPQKLNCAAIAHKRAATSSLERWGEKYSARTVRAYIKELFPEIKRARFKELLEAKDQHFDRTESFRLVRDDLHEHEEEIPPPSHAAQSAAKERD